MEQNENSNTQNRLQELGGSDYKIVDGQPNIKGWTVKDQQGCKLGEVDELIFDPESRKVRYIVLDMDGNELDLDDREVLVPIGLAQLHEDDDDVILPGVTSEQLASLPEYFDDYLNPEMETNVRNIFSGAGAVAGGTSDAAFYDHEHFNEENLYQRRRSMSETFEDRVPLTENTIPVIEENIEIGKKEVHTGGVRLESKIVEKPVEQTINLKSETVNIEHNTVNRPATDQDLTAMEDINLEMKNRIEVPVIEKDARVVEEVSLNKTVDENEETIKDTVRNTEVNIDRIDPDDDSAIKNNS